PGESLLMCLRHRAAICVKIAGNPFYGILIGNVRHAGELDKSALVKLRAMCEDVIGEGYLNRTADVARHGEQGGRMIRLVARQAIIGDGRDHGNDQRETKAYIDICPSKKPEIKAAIKARRQMIHRSGNHYCT